jgi:hypothetical protein
MIKGCQQIPCSINWGCVGISLGTIHEDVLMKALNICCASVKDILYGEYMPLYAYACNK